MALISDQFYNRDLSWLRFNHRVLQEAADTRNPLYERIKFLAIFSSNLDEFFKVRVSDIRQIKELDKPLRKKLITKPNRLLRKIKKEVDAQQEEFGRIFSSEILPALEAEQIFLLPHTKFTEAQQAFSKEYFKEHLEEHTTVAVSEGKPFVENEALYLVGHKEGNPFVWAKIDEDHPRFINLPKEGDSHYIAFVDDILKHNLEALHGTPFYAIKVSRDAELYIENEYSGNLLDKIKEALPNRTSGQVTRALIDQATPRAIVSHLETVLDINETDIVKGGSYHNFKDFFGFPNPTDKDFEFESLPPIPNPELQQYDSMFTAIEEKDRMLFFPYEAFDDVVRLVEEAAAHEEVTTIKATLYRVSKDSLVAKALLKAAQAGKDVYVFIETKARFDEENNIKWGKILEEHGAKVNYSYPGIKVHSKILYIEKKTETGAKGYAYIGTGNFNEKTAKIYTDFGLMTAHPKITSELLQVFQVLEGNLIIPKTKKLLISPFTTRKKFSKMVAKEIEYAQNGDPAAITLKLNSLQDNQMIDLLYQASNAGVQIRLLVRGICGLVPGVKGQSENIYVTSVVDRFLEHGRVYLFHNGGKEKMYIGSADWMTRNLDHRIEVITPILDADIQQSLKENLELQLSDTVKARVIDQEQSNTYVSNEGKEQSSQHLIYRNIKQR